MITREDTQPRPSLNHLRRLANLGFLPHEPWDLTPLGFGWHLVLDLVGCDTAALGNGDTLHTWVTTLVAAIDMTPYGDPLIVEFGEGDLFGYTVVQLITTSSITAHCEPRRPGDDGPTAGRLHADVFSCKGFDPLTVVHHTIGHLGGSGGHATFLPRG